MASAGFFVATYIRRKPQLSLLALTYFAATWTFWSKDAVNLFRYTLPCLLTLSPCCDAHLAVHLSFVDSELQKRWRVKLDGEILMMLDGTREDEASGGGFGRWKGPCVKVWGE